MFRVVEACCLLVCFSQVVELPSVGLSRRLKSIQTFKMSVSDAPAGARVGISVAQFDVKRLERGFVAAPGLLNKAHAVVAQIKKSGLLCCFVCALVL